MKKDFFNNHAANTVVIVFLILLFVSVIYVPKTIWDYEDELRDVARFRMETVAKAEKLHYQLTKSYTSNPDQLLLVVNGVRDSLLLAEMDSNYSYFGFQKIPLPGRSLPVNYNDEYRKLYEELHLNLFKQLNPNHHMDPEFVTLFIDSIKTLFDAGNYTGAQTMMIDSVDLSFTVSDKFDILYQNIKTSMFNALTSSYTKYPEFSNPLVDAVLDSISKNPELDGRTDFAGIYDGSVKIDFIIPMKFEENLEKTKFELKKHFIVDAYDSSTYGDTLYQAAVMEFMTQLDTTGTIPYMLSIMMEDTALGMVEVPIDVKVEEMEAALNKRRNTLYKMLTGYGEPSPFIAEQVIAVAIDSLDSPGVGLDSFYTHIDLTDAVFNINVHQNIASYFNRVSLEQAYYKSAVNRSDLDWNAAAIEVVEYVAEQLRGKEEYSKWQVVEAAADTFHVNVFDNFLRRYDDMNLKLYEKLTGEFTNRFDYAFDVIAMAETLAAIDTLNWSGAQVMEIPDDTLLVDVFPLYLQEYDTTFIIPRDTVVRIDDSTFTGVWYRGMMGVVSDVELDTLSFLSLVDNSQYIYDFHGTDSVKGLNVLEKSDTARVEAVYFGDEVYVMIFNDDSLMENIHRVADFFDEFDSLTVIDSLTIVSDEFVVGEQEKFIYTDKDSFYGWIDTTVFKKFVKKELYSRYLLQPDHVLCPVTELPYRITIRDDIHLSIESPITRPIETSRYLFFTQLDSSHGRIEDGEASWAE